MKYFIILLWAVAGCFQTYSQITEIGVASFYDDKFEGRVTASGEIFSQKLLTAAHRTFPFGTQAKITNLGNKKSVIVIINDRGPYVNDRIIDLTRKAAQDLGFIGKGTAKVKIEVVKLGTENTLVKEKPAEPKAKTEPAAPIVNPEPTVAKAPATTGETLEYFRLETEKIEPKGFGIQVASYQDAANLIKRCSEIKSKTAKNVMVQMAENQEKKIYRIVIGPFATRELADEYLKIQGSPFPGSFVIGL